MDPKKYSFDSLTKESLAAQCSIEVGVKVRAYCTQEHTVIEVWQEGPEFGVGADMVQRYTWPRRLDERPDRLLVASFLARAVSDMDRQGWPTVQS